MGAGYCRGCHSIRSSLLHAADWLFSKAAGMQSFKAIKAFTIFGREVQIGDTLDLSPLQATQCINLGLVEPVASQLKDDEPSQAGQAKQDALSKKRR